MNKFPLLANLPRVHIRNVWKLDTTKIDCKPTRKSITTRLLDTTKQVVDLD